MSILTNKRTNKFEYCSERIQYIFFAVIKYNRNKGRCKYCQGLKRSPTAFPIFVKKYF